LYSRGDWRARKALVPAVTRAQMSCAEVSRLGGLDRLKSMDWRLSDVFCEYVNSVCTVQPNYKRLRGLRALDACVC